MIHWIWIISADAERHPSAVLTWCDLMCFPSFKMSSTLQDTMRLPGKGPFSGPGPMTFPYNYRTRSGLSRNLLTCLNVVCRLQYMVNDSKNPWTWIGWCVMLLNMIMPDRFRKATRVALRPGGRLWHASLCEVVGMATPCRSMWLLKLHLVQSSQSKWAIWV